VKKKTYFDNVDAVVDVGKHDMSMTCRLTLYHISRLQITNILPAGQNRKLFTPSHNVSQVRMVSECGQRTPLWMRTESLSVMY